MESLFENSCSFLLFYEFSIAGKWRATQIPQCFNPFHATGLWFYTPEKVRKLEVFSGVFRGYRKRPVAWDGFNIYLKLGNAGSCKPLTQLFPMNPFSTPWKHYREVEKGFQGIENGCIGNKWVNGNQSSYGSREVLIIQYFARYWIVPVRNYKLR